MHNTQGFFTTYESLAAPASGQSTLVQLGGDIVTQNYTLFTTVSNINTNVVIALNGSVDGENWSKIIGNTTISTNGTSHTNVANHPVKYVQPIFVSESGGTAATVLFSLGASA